MNIGKTTETRNIAGPTPEPVLHGKILKDDSVLLYVSKRQRQSIFFKLRNFLFETMAGRSARANSALAGLAIGEQRKVHLPHVSATSDVKNTLRFLILPGFAPVRRSFVDKHQCHREVNFMEAYWDFRSNPSEEKARKIYERFFDAETISKPLQSDYLNLSAGDEKHIKRALGAYQMGGGQTGLGDFVSALDQKVWHSSAAAELVKHYQTFAENFDGV